MSSKVSLHTFSIKLLPLPSQGGIPGTMRGYYILVYFLKGKEDAKNAMKSLNAKTSINTLEKQLVSDIQSWFLCNPNGLKAH